jgi:ankyrin repeat protein
VVSCIHKSKSKRILYSNAAQNEHNAVVKMLLNFEKVDIDSKDSTYSRTPLSWAAQNGHDAAVKLLLDSGKANVNSREMCGWMPLLVATRNGHNAVVKLLLDPRKADYNLKEFKYGWGRRSHKVSARHREGGHRLGGHRR